MNRVREPLILSDFPPQVKNRSVFFAVTLLALLAMRWGYASARSAHQLEGDRVVVVLMAPLDEQVDMAPLVAAFEGHLSDLDVSIESQLTEQADLSPRERMQLVRETMNAAKLLALFWLDPERDTFHIIVPDGETYKKLDQAIPHSADGWLADCGTMAMVFRSSLAFWLNVGTSGVSNLYTAITRLDQSPPRAAPPRKTPHPPVAPVGERDSRQLIHVITRGGYALSFFDIGGPLGHGVLLSVGIQIGRHLESGLSLRLFQSADLEIPGRDVRLNRWPAELWVAGIWPIRAVDLGLSLGITADIIHLDGLGQETRPDQNPPLKMALSPAVKVRWRSTRWLALWAELGLDLYSKEYNYYWGDDIKLHYDRVQPGIALGLTMILPVD